MIQPNHHSHRQLFLLGLLLSLSSFFIINLSACSSQVKTTSPTLASPSLPTPSEKPPVFTPMPTPALVLKPTVKPVTLEVFTWKSEPKVPVILYHQFIGNNNAESSKTKIRLGDFLNHLQTLYDNGYSLVPLNQWLDGDLTLPVGRRPLILTMDDAFFANQIFLNDDGTPSDKSGVGVLWQFSQQHPDFGFSAALFANMGDKAYANIIYKNTFLFNENWKDSNESLTKVIIWCIENGVMPYNHMYHHPRLDLTNGKDIPSEMQLNDAQIRKDLQSAGREDLIPKIQNIIALPYGAWPPAKGADKLIKNYLNPEGVPVKAVLEADYYHDSNNLLFSPYSPKFDRYHIPRITMNTTKALKFLVDDPGLIPVTQKCTLAPMEADLTRDPDLLAAQIKQAILNGACQPGFFLVNGFYFDASGPSIIQGKIPPIVKQ